MKSYTTFLGNNHRVILKHVHDKSFKARKVISVQLIDSEFIVDIGKKCIVLEILFNVSLVLVILRLKDTIPDERVVDTELHHLVPHATLRVIRGTAGKRHDSLVLGSKCNKSTNWWIIVSLNISAEKLPTLREANSIETTFQLINGAQLLPNFSNLYISNQCKLSPDYLSVDIVKERVPLVIRRILADSDWVNENFRTKS